MEDIHGDIQPLSNGPDDAPSAYFDDCGVLVQAVECVLFQADTGGLYLLNNLDKFQVGDYVRVRGILNPSCVSICMQGNGCIEYNTISACLRADLDGDYNVDIDDFAILLSHWLETGCAEPDFCDGADLNRDGIVDTNDFSLFADSWLNSSDDEPNKPGLSKYYTPFNNPIEPNAPGYTLPLDLGTIGNHTALDSMFGLNNAAPLLEQNGFAIIEHDFGWFDPNRDDIVKPYEYLRDREVPLFVTADTLLHL